MGLTNVWQAWRGGGAPCQSSIFNNVRQSDRVLTSGGECAEGGLSMEAPRLGESGPGQPLLSMIEKLWSSCVGLSRMMQDLSCWCLTSPDGSGGISVIQGGPAAISLRVSPSVLEQGLLTRRRWWSLGAFCEGGERMSACLTVIFCPTEVVFGRYLAPDPARRCSPTSMPLHTNC